MERQASQPDVTAAPVPAQQLEQLLASVSSDLEAVFAGTSAVLGAEAGGPVASQPRMITFVAAGAPARKNFLTPLAVAVGGGAVGLFALTSAPPGQPFPPAATAVAPSSAAIALVAPAAPVTPASAPPPQTVSIPAPPPVAAAKARADVNTTPAKTVPKRGKRGAPRMLESEASYTALMQADRRLRVAYSNAIRADVDNQALVGYRNRWARARQEAARNPRWALSDYRGLERDLYDEADDARSANRDQ